MRKLYSLLIITLLSAFPTISIAGSSHAGRSILPANHIAAFADRVQHDLASRGVRVALVARMGRDPSTLPHGIKYTHVSYWVFSNIKFSNGSTGQGYQVYNLYQQAQNAARSDLIQDSPADFFSGAQRLDAGIIIPDIRLQKKLLKVIASPQYRALHNANYSVLANPNTTQFQNCTEHTLDILMASLYGTKDIRQIKANIAAYFEPQSIKIGGLKRALAPVASRGLTTADHDENVKTATFGTLARFMQENDLASKIYRLTPDKALHF